MAGTDEGKGTVTVLDEGRVSQVPGSSAGGRLVVEAGSLETAIGFVRKPEGLCRGDVCVPVRAGGGIVVDGGVDVTALAAVLGRAIAVDEEAGAAFLGAASAERADRLRSLEAPDFTLPDLDGRPHSLSEHRGKKVLLAAYASW